MEKKLKIHYFGCSFTALESSLTGHEFVNYRKLIDDSLNVTSENYSKTGKSNQHIFDDIYNCVNSIKNQREYKHLFVIQTTFNDRLGLPCDIEDRFTSMCKRNNPENYTEEIQIKFYNDWLKYFYSRANALKEFRKQVELNACYLDKNNVAYVFVGIDETLDFITEKEFFGKYRFLEFENTFSYYKHATQKKLRIADLDHFTPVNSAVDYHFSKEGHRVLAEKLIETIKTIC